MPTTLMGFPLQSFSLGKEQAFLFETAFALRPLSNSTFSPTPKTESEKQY
jgi:hypothetical protein